MKAVVVGAGIAGLACAKALSKSHDEVIVYSGGPQPQGLHLHALLKKGQSLLEELFPGSLEKLKQKQAPIIDWSLDTQWNNSRGAFPRYPSDIRNLSMSHSAVRDIMMEDIQKTPSIQIRNEIIKDISEIETDLLVIASGAQANIRPWIKSEEMVPLNLTYRSFIFKKSDLNLTGFKQYYFQLNPPHSPLGAVVCPIEDGLMVVTMIQHQKDYVTCIDFADFKNLASQIPDSQFLKILGKAQPLSKISTFRKVTSFRRTISDTAVHKKVLFVGDCLTSLNPVFGQGMTVSLMQAHYLQNALNQGMEFRYLQKNLERLAQGPFQLSKMGSQTSGVGKTLLNIYLRLCQKSKTLHNMFLNRLHHP